MTFNESEVVRDTAGRFGEKPQSDAEVRLQAPGNAGCDRCGTNDREPGSRFCARCTGWRPGEPVYATFVLETWDGDYSVPVDEVRVDVRALLDMRSMEGLEDPDDFVYDDELFYEARALGLVEHDGPFTVQLGDTYGDYFEHRQENGLEEPLAAVFIDTPERAVRRLDAVNEQMKHLRKTAERTAQDLVVAEAALIPGAASVEYREGTLVVRDAAGEHLSVGERTAERLRAVLSDIDVQVSCDLRRADS